MSQLAEQFAAAVRSLLFPSLEVESVQYAARKKNPDLMQPSLFDASPQRKLADLGAGHWITMHASESGEGGSRVFIGDDGKMKTGKFAGMSMKEAFGKSRSEKTKRSTKRGDKHEQGQPGLFETETQPTLPGIGPGNAMEVDAIKTAEKENKSAEKKLEPEVDPPKQPTAKERELAEFEQSKAAADVGPLAQSEDEVPKSKPQPMGNQSKPKPPSEEPKSVIDMLKDILGDQYKTGDGKSKDERELERLEAKRVELNKQGANSRSSIVSKQRARVDLDEKIQRLREKIEASKPTDRPALEVPAPAENSDAKPGDQMGLFGEVANAPKAGSPTLKTPEPETAGKQSALFDTKGDPDQMLMFDDGVTPEDRLMKPEEPKPQAKPKKTKSSFDPAAMTKIAADSIGKLRKADVYRLLDSSPPEHMQSMADYITKNRGDLASEVSEQLADIHEERGTKPEKYSSRMDPAIIAFWVGRESAESQEVKRDRLGESVKYSAPSESQAEAGNYKMDHKSVKGLRISVETKKGERRKPDWPKMPCDYGYIKGTMGRDGDHVDVFLGPDHESDLVVIVDQVNQDGKFDEHKCLLGFHSESEAIETYKQAYTKDWRVGPVSCLTIKQFKNWLEYGDQKKPAHPQVVKYTSREDRSQLTLLSDLVPLEVVRYEWNASDHPRYPAGTGDKGGEFAPKNRPGGALPAHQLKAAQATTPQAWADSMNEGRKPVAANPGSSQSNLGSSTANPASPPVGSPVKPPVNPTPSSKKRELAALPTIERGHPLHHSALGSALQGKLLEINGRLEGLMRPMGIAVGQAQTPEARAAAEEWGWNRVDKNAIRGILDELNQLDHSTPLPNGSTIADYVNANGIIPRELAERLDSGSRFFDPEKMRGKFNRQQPAMEPEKQTARAFSTATAEERKKMLENPEKRAAIEKAMGLKPSAEPVQQPGEATSSPSPVETPKQPSPGSEAKLQAAKPPKDAPPAGMSRIADNRLNQVIKETVGENPEAVKYFKGIALEAHNQIKDEAENHNDALRQISSFFGKHLGSMAANLTKGIDPSKIKGFDELIDHAVREYPQVLSRLMGDSSAGGPEDALVAAFREGIRDIPQPYDEAVISRAVDLAGQNFFDSLDSADEPEPEDSGEDWAANELEEEAVPFSARRDELVKAIVRYWMKDERDVMTAKELVHYGAMIERYGAQMEFNWDEAAHPRAPKGTENAGEFVKREANPQSKPVKPKRDLPDGYVEQPRAKAGGEVSSVDGKFYKGGALMPVHGLFSGQEKPPAKPKKQDGTANSVKADSESGPRAIRERSQEEIEEVKRRWELQAQWDGIRNSPIGKALHLKDNPHHIKWGHGVLDTWLEQAAMVGNDWMQRAADEAKSIVLEEARKKEVPEDHVAWTINHIEEQASSDLYLKRQQKKMKREFPDAMRAREYLNWLDSEKIPEAIERMTAKANTPPKADKSAKKLELDRAQLSETEKQLEKLQKQFDTWQAKNYKDNSHKIDRKDDAGEPVGMQTIGDVNEKRRRKAMDTLRSQIDDHKKLADTLRKRISGIEFTSQEPTYTVPKESELKKGDEDFLDMILNK